MDAQPRSWIRSPAAESRDLREYRDTCETLILQGRLDLVVLFGKVVYNPSW